MAESGTFFHTAPQRALPKWPIRLALCVRTYIRYVRPEWLACADVYSDLCLPGTQEVRLAIQRGRSRPNHRPAPNAPDRDWPYFSSDNGVQSHGGADRYRHIRATRANRRRGRHAPAERRAARSPSDSGHAMPRTRTTCAPPPTTSPHSSPPPGRRPSARHSARAARRMPMSSPVSARPMPRGSSSARTTTPPVRIPARTITRAGSPACSNSHAACAAHRYGCA